ncbi:MAG: hypothetical protein JNJ83_12970 [Verrucomicrobiaceae bacterium]|nr:hypothetical protein [Verrucomicrobiaceae bacterium]
MKTLLLTLAMTLALAASYAEEREAIVEPFDLITTDGKMYLGCSLREIAPDSVLVMTANGVARVPLDKLSAQWQEKFGYNEDAAAEHKRSEKEKQKEAREEASAKSIASLQAQLAAKDAELAQLKIRLQALEAQVQAQAQALAVPPPAQVIERVQQVPVAVPYVVNQPVYVPVVRPPLYCPPVKQAPTIITNTPVTRILPAVRSSSPVGASMRPGTQTVSNPNPYYYGR